MKKINPKNKRLIRNRNKLKKVNNDRYRIAVFKSLKNISAQIIDDKINKTIVSATSIKAIGIAASWPKASTHSGIPIYP